MIAFRGRLEFRTVLSARPDEDDDHDDDDEKADDDGNDGADDDADGRISRRPAGGRVSAGVSDDGRVGDEVGILVEVLVAEEKGRRVGAGRGVQMNAERIFVVVVDISSAVFAAFVSSSNADGFRVFAPTFHSLTADLREWGI